MPQAAQLTIKQSVLKASLRAASLNLNLFLNGVFLPCLCSFGDAMKYDEICVRS